MALADMLNAAPQCDLLEVRLDRFAKAPDVGELLAHKPKPIILSCRRRQDGGDWDGSEEERLALLRQCIVSKADYVEIELDVADQIRPFPPAKRVISYTNFKETPPDIADIYATAQTKHPDVIKLVTLARTPEAAWPLLQILSKPALPTVAVGLGKPGVMLSVLGKKIGSPWTYAALERGMETYPGQPTVRELNEVYHYPAISRTTRLIGVTGFGPTGIRHAGRSQCGTDASRSVCPLSACRRGQCSPVPQDHGRHPHGGRRRGRRTPKQSGRDRHRARNRSSGSSRGRSPLARGKELARLQHDRPGGARCAGGRLAGRILHSRAAPGTHGHDRGSQCHGPSRRLRYPAARRSAHPSPAIGATRPSSLPTNCSAGMSNSRRLYTTTHDILVVCDDESSEGNASEQPASRASTPATSDPE